MDDDPLLPISAAAKAVGLHKATLWRYVSSGAIQPHARTPGGHLRFRAGQLARELEAQPESTRTVPQRPDLADPKD